MRYRTAFIVVLATLVTVSGVSACSEQTSPADSEDAVESTLTIEEANQRLEQHIQAAQAGLPAEAEYKLDSKYENSPCSDPSGQGAEGRVFASRTYEVLNLSTDRIPDYFSSMRNWWESHNFRVLTETPNKYLWVENKMDSFRMGFKSNDLGKIFIGGDSPCVWPSGTPASQE
jgi:uncharacterized membrane protein